MEGGAFWALFDKFKQKLMCLEKKGSANFKYSKHLSICHKSDKTNEPFLRKMPNRGIDGQTVRQTDRQADGWTERQRDGQTEQWTERQTDNGYFVGPSI